MAEITPIGITNFRGREIKFGIKRDDRRRHMYLIGKTGTGKTTLLENMAIHDIVTGEGVGYIDAHGDSAEKLLDYIPKERINDVVYFNPKDLDWPIAFNPLEKVPWEFRQIVASSLMSVFKKIWIDAWSARMEYILTNTLLALLEFPDSTLLDIQRMLGDLEYRKNIVKNIKDPVVKSFWENEFARYTPQFRVEAIAPIQNKIGQFITNPLIRNIVGQKESSFNLREVIDNKKILIVNLSKGAIGEDSASLLGGIIITKIQLAAMSRVDLPENERQDFFLYIDEFQNFGTEAFINILSEARKYHLSLILANQYLDQLPSSVVQGILGNVGTIICFRVGPTDATILEKELIEFKSADLVNLPKYHIYIKLLIEGIASRAFSAVTLPPPPQPSVSFKEEIIQFSRATYSQSRRIVEHKIATLFKGLDLGIKKEDLISTKCRFCQKEILIKKGEENLCQECKFAPEVGIKIEKALSSGLVQSFKKKSDDQKKEESDLEELLKKIEDSSNE